MTHWVVTHLNFFFAHYGYWTVFLGILLESAGVPLPGETILILASVFARTQHRLSIADVAIVAVVAAVTGDNIGFAVGRYGGRPLLDRYRNLFHIEDETVHKGKSLFARHGGMADISPALLPRSACWPALSPACCACPGASFCCSMLWEL